MPVFHRVQSGVLVMTVDGDFTTDEVVRVGNRSLSDPDLISPAFVLLDLSGTSGLDASSYKERLDPVADFLAGPQAPVARLAVLAAPVAAAVMVGAATAYGLESKACKSKKDAMEWLLGM